MKDKKPVSPICYYCPYHAYKDNQSICTNPEVEDIRDGCIKHDEGEVKQ